MCLQYRTPYTHCRRPIAPSHSKLWGRNLARQLWQGDDHRPIDPLTHPIGREPVTIRVSATRGKPGTMEPPRSTMTSPSLALPIDCFAPVLPVSARGGRFLASGVTGMGGGRRRGKPSLEGCWEGRASRPPIAQRAGGIISPIYTYLGSSRLPLLASTV